MKIVVSFVLLIGALFLLEWIYTFGYLHNQNIKLPRIKRPVNADVLFLGPCEPHWGISPEMLQKNTGVRIYNLALNNSDFADNYLHLHLYLKSNKPPEFVFLYLTPASFDKHTNTFNSYRFAPYLNDPLVDPVVSDVDPDYYRWSKLPFMKYAYYNNEVTFNVFQGYKHFFAGRNNAYYEDGYEPPAEFARDVTDGKLVISQKPVIYTFDKKRAEYLVKIIRLAQSVGSEVVLYESPVYEPYLELELNRPEIENRIHEISKQESVRFVQFRDLSIAKDPANFNAPRNFNRRGVVLFSDTLERYLNAIRQHTNN